MARDRLEAMRVALHGGDAAAMVAAVQSGGFDASLQLAGEVLLVATHGGAVGAADAARRCVVALHTRGWDGDDELADALSDALTGSPPELAELAIDLEELASLLDAGPDSTGGRIDLTTGIVWPDALLDDDWTGKPDDLDVDDPDRWLAVWPEGSRAAYRDMIDFAASRTDSRLAAQLDRALDGRGAFGRFKRVLSDWPDDSADWFAFADNRSRGRARAWLADAGYRASFKPIAPHDDGG
ncbi:MAG TPA: UPF0158 family protein [Jatrophihabitans sp.]|jgi:hypothetical protein|uniref:UPF0158 family protein n=1 Tax=Jatrophihabitans sp. TaxID=1932789 RepID=UPI002DFB3DA1|nr:UPF0158 family protein [Jatrophihabitans sp.]